MQTKPTRLAWIDLETTGFPELDDHGVYRHRILELGLAVTDGQFELLDSLSLSIYHAPELVEALVDQDVSEMHAKSGLFSDVEASVMDLRSAEQQAIRFFQSHGITAQSSPLCGSSVFLDRAFIESQMPELNSLLHYRNLDISSIKEFIKLFAPQLEPPKKKTHRALDDILESISEARTYQVLLGPCLVGS